MTHNPNLSCLNAPHRFPPFYNRLVSPKKYICTHVLARPYPSDSFKASLVSHSMTTQARPLLLLRFQFVSSLPQYAPLCIYIYICHSLQSSL
ncbi:unnamed protein product [Hymenolepis diminuta]|uniref:Uncharacterized protein n=1 Tax=Hymenolepis diminuta TaxID=6216 RepID=A0A564Z0R6_HYMDI|nr:unnamed protein product [Hymenolepis diminuta]